MEVKKVDEALTLTSQALTLLMKYPHCRLAPMSIRSELYTICESLLPCLHILLSFESDHHKQIGTEYINERTTGSKVNCHNLSPNGGNSDAIVQDKETALRFSERLSAVYETVLSVLHQVMQFGINTNDDIKDSDYPDEDNMSPAISTEAVSAHSEEALSAHPNTEASRRVQGNVQNVEEDSVGSSATDVSFAGVFGCEEAKKALLQVVFLPIKCPFLFAPPRKSLQKVLLYGPPGTGKTCLAAAVANSFSSANGGTKLKLFTITASQLLDKYVGESEKQIQRIFGEAHQLVCKDPNTRCILFFDEIDALCGSRGNDKESELARRVKTELLLALQNVTKESGIVVMAATNLPWEIDGAIRRRFDRFVYVGLPDARTRLSILRHHFSKIDHRISSAEFKAFVHCKQIQLGSPSDLINIINHALMKPYEIFFDFYALPVVVVGGGGDADRNISEHRLSEPQLSLRIADEEDWDTYDRWSIASSSPSSGLSESRSPVPPTIKLSTASTSSFSESQMNKDAEDATAFHIAPVKKDRSKYRQWYVLCPPSHPEVLHNAKIVRHFTSLNLLEEEAVGVDATCSHLVCEDQLLLPPVRYSHLLDALDAFIPNITDTELQKYQNWEGK